MTGPRLGGVRGRLIATLASGRRSPGRTGAAGGLFQTSRYVGAIAATATIGVLFDRDLSSGGLHALGAVMTGGAVLVLVLAVLVRAPSAR